MGKPMSSERLARLRRLAAEGYAGPSEIVEHLDWLEEQIAAARLDRLEEQLAERRQPGR